MNLNERIIFEVANSQLRSKAISLISQNVDHSNRTPSDESRNEILFGSLLDLIHFSLEKGFSLSECVACCSIFYTLIKKMNANLSLTLTESLDLFSFKLLSLSNLMSKVKIRQYIDYMNLTFFTHFNLFKYVFTHDRENRVYTENRLVNCPENEEDMEDKGQSSLANAKTSQLFEYDKEYQKLEDEGNSIRKKYDKEREKIIKTEESEKCAYAFDDMVNEQIIEEMIKDISFPKMDTAFKLAQTDIAEFGELHGVKSRQSKLVKPEPISFAANKKGKNKGKK